MAAGRWWLLIRGTTRREPVEVFRRRGCGVRSSAGWPCTHAARGGTGMDIEDGEVFIGTGRRQGASTGPRP